MKRVNFLLMSLCFSIASCAPAHAATSNINASGTISTVCSFSSTTAGTLAVQTSNLHRIATDTSGGTSAGFNIQYMGTPTITLNTPTTFDNEPSASSSLSKTFGLAVMSQNGGIITGSSGTFSYAETGGTSDIFTVDFSATYQQNVPFGTYGISSIATCQ